MSFDPLHRWNEAEPWLDRALQLPEEERSRFVEQRVDDEDLRRQIIGLLERAAAEDGQDSRVGLSTRRLDRWPIGGVEPGTVLGPFRVVERLGSGGMADVFLAVRVDDPLEQRVALKVQHGTHVDEASRRRFLAEGRFLVGLSHPCIAKVFESGFFEDDPPRAYLSLEYVDGKPIDEHCRERSLDLENVLRLFVQAAKAVEFAHEHLIVHRDLKPANLFVTDRGEVKLLDFGIAKLLVEANEDGDGQDLPVTRTRQLLLTPPYAAPEQARGLAITTRTDVWGLGVVLYELLTGTRPFTGREEELLDAICDQSLVTPSSRLKTRSAASSSCTTSKREWSAGHLVGDLDTIVAKALRKEPNERYPSAAALAEDVERFLANRPITARPPTVTYRLARFVRRHRVASGVAAALMVLALVQGGVLWHQYVETGRERDRAARERDRAEVVSGFLIDLFRAGDPKVNLGMESSVGDLLDIGQAQLDELEEPSTFASLAVTLGNARRELGDLEGATTLHRLAVDRLAAMVETDPDEEHRWRLATAQLEYGATLNRRSDEYLLAEEQFEAALAGFRSLPWERGGEQAVNVLNALALLEKERGDLGAALERYGEFVGELSGVGGELQSTTLFNYGQALADAARYDEAVEALERALLAGESVLVPEHPHLGSIYRLAGAVLTKVDRHAEAAEHLRRAAENAAAVYGDEHPEYANLLNSLAELQRRRGDFRGSVESYQKALGIYATSYGEDHLAVSIVAASLCYSLTQAREYLEAVRHCDRAVEVATEALGRSNRYRATALKFQGIVELMRGDDRSAERLLNEAETVFAETLGVDSFQRAECLVFRAARRVLRGQRREAGPLAREATRIFEATLGPEHRTSRMSRAWFELAESDGPGVPLEVKRRIDGLRADYPADDLIFELFERVALTAKFGGP